MCIALTRFIVSKILQFSRRFRFISYRINPVNWKRCPSWLPQDSRIDPMQQHSPTDRRLIFSLLVLQFEFVSLPTWSTAIGKQFADPDSELNDFLPKMEKLTEADKQVLHQLIDLWQERSVNPEKLLNKFMSADPDISMLISSESSSLPPALRNRLGWNCICDSADPDLHDRPAGSWANQLER